MQLRQLRWLGGVCVCVYVTVALGQQQVGSIGVFGVAEIAFRGPMQTPADSPARDIEFWARFRHDDSGTEYKVHGFWDGDGRGGTRGDAFAIRFCPTRPGKWVLVEVHSSARELNRQKQGGMVLANASRHPGFWIVDPQSPGGRWYQRSDGSHPYIIGNTHYSFLSGFREDGKPTDNDIARDIRENGKYFRKLRFTLHGDRYPHPQEKPFFDDDGRPTDSGDFSHRPNPRWFQQRVDLAVVTAWEVDLIADLILAGPDTEDSRATLRASGNANDATPWLRYVAARYGSYPNVWICLSNEYNIKKPAWSEAQIAAFGRTIRSYLPYPTPLSVHASPPTVWAEAFDRFEAWNDHQIVQLKLKKIAPAADVMQAAWGAGLGRPRNRPTINDELSYEGAGDRHLEGDTIEAHLGAFLGGGYASTGHKTGNKLGQYFGGDFDPADHTSADNLRFFREVIDRQITFWKMAPDLGIFSNLDEGFRGMAWSGREYVLGTNRARRGIVAQLPEGTWRVAQHDLLACRGSVISERAEGRFVFDAPETRAVLVHFRRTAGR